MKAHTTSPVSSPRQPDFHADRCLGTISMFCSAARAPAAAPAGCPHTASTFGRAGRSLHTARRSGSAIRPCAASSSSSSTSAQSDYAPDERLQATIADIDALLGIDVVAARAEAQAAAVAAPASGASAAEQAVPAEWAHLPAEELVRRQKLVSEQMGGGGSSAQ